MRIIFLLLVASLTFAQKPALQKDRQVLMDFRKNTETAEPQIPLAAQKDGVVEGVSPVPD
ncbi:MAG TPA: hypothetical protein VK274_06435 [Pyrinomonadaceae bacterium]|nr:hypothetical protein [Pyrinomonadaceae bacterium]